VSIELALLGQILMLAEDEHTSSATLSMTVANSPMLAANVVRVSNSALYGMEGRVARLERAVLVLGVRTVASIASTVLARGLLDVEQVGALGSGGDRAGRMNAWSLKLSDSCRRGPPRRGN